MTDRPPTDSQGDDETAVRPKSASEETAIRDRKSDTGESNANATILRAPVQNQNATILREPAPDGSSNATIIRTPSPSPQQPVEAETSRSNSDQTTHVRDSGPGDDDATVIADGGDDDSTVIGPRATASDTTYIAAVGKQIESKSNSEAGRLLKNRFVLEEKIGSGGMGDVYKALDLRAQEAQEKNPYQAIKLLNENFSRHKDAFVALQREASKTRGIPHKNIMGVYDFDREGDTVYMTMELLTGMPLDDYLKEHPEGVSIEDAWNIIDGVCQGLSRAHGAGIVHSDFKPGNIFYTEEKVAKVFDFGIARAVEKPGEIRADGEKTVFDAGSLGALTPTYASYEMLKGMEPSKSDDVYAVALVAYELFTGKHPYDRVPADKALERGMVPKRIPELKRRHWNALKNALALKGEDRTQTVDEFHEGMFSEDPPILRNTAIVAVLLGSIGFGVYSLYFTGPIEIPEELQVQLDQQQKSRITLNDRLQNENWESDEWHKQINESLTNMKRATYVVSQDWKEFESPENLEKMQKEVADIEKKILEAYLAKILELKTFAIERGGDAESVKTAIEELEAASKYIQIAEANNFNRLDPAAVASQKAAVEIRLEDRQKESAALVELAAQEAAREAARLEQERINIENERIRGERRVKYDEQIAVLKNVLTVQCPKFDIPDEKIRELGNALSELQALSPEWYASNQENIAKALRGCIQLNIGVPRPQRAVAVKEQVMAFFPNEPIISGIQIQNRDPCTAKGLVGRGYRNLSWCEDELAKGGTGPQLVVIPEKPGRKTAEESEAEDEIAKFAISRTEIKVGDYNRYCEAVGCEKLPGANPLRPATNLTIGDAKAYTAWLSEQSGRQYRLPTVKEWVWAAKTNTEKYFVDDNVNCSVDSRGVRLGETLLSALSGRPNKWGLYNPVGNAREWAEEPDGSLLALGGAHTDAMTDCRDAEDPLERRSPMLVTHDGQADPVTGFRILREIGTTCTGANCARSAELASKNANDSV